jgi:hypothetical protein
MKRTILLLVVLAVGSVLAALGAVVAPKAPVDVPQIGVVEHGAACRSTAATYSAGRQVLRSVFVKGTGKAVVLVVLPDGSTLEAATFNLAPPAGKRSTLLLSLRLGEPVSEADLPPLEVAPKEGPMP